MISTPNAINTELNTVNLPRIFACAISAAYTETGELDKPAAIPVQE